MAQGHASVNLDILATAALVILLPKSSKKYTFNDCTVITGYDCLLRFNFCIINQTNVPTGQLYFDLVDQPYRLKLSRGSYGVVKLRYSNTGWGTICDDTFDQNNNGCTVICRQMGYRYRLHSNNIDAGG